MVAVRPVHREHANDVGELIECVALTGAQAAKLNVFADSCPNEALPVNLDMWKFVFRQDEGQHPSVPENAAFRLTHTKDFVQVFCFFSGTVYPRITLLLHLFGEPILCRSSPL